MFLVRFRGQKCLEEPLSIMDLLDLTDRRQCRDTLTHYWDFPRSITYSFNPNRCRRAGIDDAFVIADRDEGPTVVKYAPIFLYQGHQCIGFLLRQVRNV